MYKEYDVVKLKKDLPKENLFAGEEGTIVMCYKNPLGYEIEFIKKKGNPILLTLTEKEFNDLFE